MTTDQMDKITAEERKALRGYCETCEDWHNFTAGKDERECPIHKTKFSNQVGFQITTQRSPLPTSKRKRRK